MTPDLSRIARRALLIAAAVEIPLVVAFYIVGMPLASQPGVLRVMVWFCQFPGILLFDPIGTVWPAATGSILRPSLTQVAVLIAANGGLIAIVAYVALRIRGAVRRPPAVVSHA